MKPPVRVRASAAVGAGLRLARRTWVASLVAAVALIGAYLAIVVAHGAVYGYDFFEDPAPSDAAETTIGFLLLGYFAMATYGVTMWFGTAAVVARQQVSTRVALRRSIAGLWRDVWWAVPAMGAALVATVFVVPGPFVIAPLATLGVIRVNRVRVRSGAVAATFARMSLASLIPTGLVVLVWAGGALVGDAPSPPTWMATVLCTTIAWLSFAAMAVVAGAAVAVLPELEPQPADWAPPLAPGSWAPPVPMRPWMPPPPVVRHPFPKARIVWIALLVVAGGTFMIAGVATMGDPYPLSRTGVVLDTNGLQVVNAVCPGNRLLRVELRESGTIDEPGATLWRVEGDAPLPRRLVVGQPVDDMQTRVPLGELADDVALEVVVEIDEIGDSYPVVFTIGELQTNRIVTDGRTFATFDQFDSAMKEDVPCGDPLNVARDRTILRTFGLVAGVLLLAAGVFAAVDVIGTRRRSRATMQ